MERRVLLTVPSFKDPGGVSSYYNSLLSFLGQQIDYLEIGRTKKSSALMHPVSDQLRFFKRLSKERPSLVHINPSLNLKCFIREGLFAWQTKRRGLPLIVFWHGWDQKFEKSIERKHFNFFKGTFGKADAFIVLANEFKEKLESWGIIVPVHVETTCVADDLTREFDADAKWEDISEEETLKVLFLARLERAKGVFETLDAVKLLADKGIAVSLTIAGDGAIRGELEKHALDLELDSSRVVFTGDVRGERKTQVFSDHHIYCFPTYYGEGMPNSVLEAMAFGMPVITRPVGGLADTFEDGNMGYLVQGKSPEEIANCLEKLVLNRPLMAKIGLFNAEYAKKNFMASVVSKRLLNIYSNVLKDNL